MVVPAEPDDLPTVVEILEDASARLPSWTPGTFRDPSGPGRRVLADGIASREVHLARLGQTPVATVTLQWEDRRFWPNAGSDAGYVHRLAVRATAGRPGIGRALLAWAEREARARGKRFLRLDCRRDNQIIRGYYERAGFAHRGDVDVGFEASLYEKPIAGPEPHHADHEGGAEG